MPHVLFKHPQPIVTVRQAEHFARLVDVEYRALTRKENVFETIRKRGHEPKVIPVFAVDCNGVHGYWSLWCNDPNMPKDTIDKMIENLRKWEHAPASPNNS